MYAKAKFLAETHISHNFKLFHYIPDTAGCKSFFFTFLKLTRARAAS